MPFDISLTGKGYAGGVVGEFSDGSCNYNVGKVTAKGKYAMAGEIAGYVAIFNSSEPQAATNALLEVATCFPASRQALTNS